MPGLKALSVKEVHYPSNAKQGHKEIGKALQAIAQPFLISFLRDNAENR